MMRGFYCLEHTYLPGHAKRSVAGLMLRQALLMDWSREGSGVRMRVMRYVESSGPEQRTY